MKWLFGARSARPTVPAVPVGAHPLSPLLSAAWARDAEATGLALEMLGQQDGAWLDDQVRQCLAVLRHRLLQHARVQDEHVALGTHEHGRLRAAGMTVLDESEPLLTALFPAAELASVREVLDLVNHGVPAAGQVRGLLPAVTVLTVSAYHWAGTREQLIHDLTITVQP